MMTNFQLCQYYSGMWQYCPNLVPTATLSRSVCPLAEYDKNRNNKDNQYQQTYTQNNGDNANIG